MARDLSIEITAETAQAEQALARVEAGIQSIEKAATPAADKQRMMADAVEDASKRAEQSITSLEKKWKDQEKAARETEKATRALRNTVMQYAGPAVIGLAIKQTLAYADSIENLSKRTGIAPSKLQALEFSAKQFGLSLDPVARSIGSMSDRLASGDKSAVAAIERLGLSFKNIRSMNPDGAFIAIAKAIAEVEDPMQRAADATDVFGRTGIELLPLLTSDIEALMEQAKKLGLVMDDETTKAAADLNSQLSNLLDVGKRLLVSFFLPLLPILNPIANGLMFMTSQLNTMIQAVLSPMAQLREFAELLGVIQTRLPNAPTGPGLTFDPGMLSTPGDPYTQGVFGQSLDYVMGRLTPKKSPAGAARVLPFVRPELMGETDWTSADVGLYFEPEERLRNALYNAQWYNMARSPLRFPGFQNELVYGAFGPMAPYAPTVRPNRPGASSSFLSGSGGRFLGAGLSSLVNFMPGLSGQGSSIGSSFGSALSGVKGIAGALGSFAPFLGPVAGLVGGLIGKLFGPSEKDKARDARNTFIKDFGGIGAVQEAASKAGFSLDGLMNAKKVADVEKEVRKLVAAIDAYEQKLADANAELADMRGMFDSVVEQGKALGYNFNESGELVSVNFEKMQEKAQEYGINLEALGPAFQQQRLHDMASEIINDFTLLNQGGTDTGTILLGMSDEISHLVQESIRFGTEIPANMKPWIENLIEANKLTDENGNAITDLSMLKFGEPVATEFEKIQSSLLDLIGKIGELVDRIAQMGQTVDVATRDRTINISYNVEPQPDVPAEYNSLGGFVGRPKYLAGGGMIPRGTDTVPAMLTPGEGVLRRDAVSRLMRGDWPSSGSGLTITVENVTVDSGARDEREFESRIGRAVVTGLRRKGVRLNAA